MDITHIEILQGFLYVTVIIDLFSRKVIGWSMMETMKTGLVKNGKINQRKPLNWG
jgi:putative transposase